MFEFDDPVYIDPSDHNSRGFSSQKQLEAYILTGQCKPGESSARILSGSLSASAPHGDGWAISPSAYRPSASVANSPWLNFVDLDVGPSLDTPFSASGLSSSSSLLLDVPVTISPLTSIALPIVADDLPPPHASNPPEYGEQDYPHLLDILSSLQVLNSTFGSTTQDAPATSPASPSSSYSCPSPLTSESDISPYVSTSEEPSSGPIRTSKSGIPAEFMTTFRFVSPSGQSTWSAQHDTATHIQCQCEKKEKMAKPLRHWRTCCPDNPSLEFVECLECRRTFKNRSDNFKRHLGRFHKGKGEGKRVPNQQ